MKHLLLLIITTIYFGSISLFAQETLLPLKYNPIYNQVNKQEKSYKNNYSGFCTPITYPNLQVTKIDTADCSINDNQAIGSISLKILNLQQPYTIKLSSPLYQINTTIQNYAFDTLTFKNLEAAPYFILVTDFYGVKQELRYSLLGDTPMDGNTTDALEINNFIFNEAFCFKPGRIRKTFQTAEQLYTIYDTTLTFSSDFTNKNFQDLTTGTYILKGENNFSACPSYMIFDIKPKKTNQTPFSEDFSNSYIYPDQNTWLGKQVCINYGAAKNPLTIGVATFDGFNELGQPYTPSNGAAPLPVGSADTLTSLPFCLGKNVIDTTNNDTIIYKPVIAADSLYLSFFYEPQGYGDYPNNGDSLILEFKTQNNQWIKAWQINGQGNTTIDSVFNQVMIKIPDSLVYQGLQFRFRNKATVSGLNDHWHIDYIKFDANRFYNSNLINDVANVTPLTSMLKHYTEMPFSHFVNNQNTERATALTINLRSFYSQAANVVSEFISKEVCSNTIVNFKPLSALLGIETPGLYTFTENINNIIPNTFNKDSLIFETTYSLNFNQDELINNDTIRQYQQFFNCFAYDDGVPEKAYALFGTGAELAYQFHLNHPDTLRAIQISFLNMNDDITDNQFKLKVWKNIKPGTNNSELIYTRTLGEFPKFYDAKYGYWTYYLDDTTLPVNDTIYIGLEQKDSDFLTIGFDKNNNANTHIFYNTSGTWEQSLFKGALMIRPVVGQRLPENINQNVGTNNNLSTNDTQFLLFPNPAQNIVQIQSTQLHLNPTIIQIFNLTGQKIDEQIINNQTFSANKLNNGIYFVQIIDKQNNIIGRQKLAILK